MPRIERVLFIQHQPDCTPSYLGERARELGMRVEVVSVAEATASTELPGTTEYDLLVPLGFGGSVLDPAVPFLAAERAMLSGAVEAGIPVFGVCFGAQLLASVLGGTVYELPAGPEIGWFPVRSTDQRLLPSGPWLVWHFDAFECPPDGRELGSTEISSQAFSWGPHIGLQFHPEAAPDNVAQWSATYRESLLRLGIDPDEMVETTRRNADANRTLAYRVFDRVVQHAESVGAG